MNKLLVKILGVILFLVAFNNLHAQEVRVNAVLDSSKIRIGEQVKIDLYLNYNADLQKQLHIDWPQIGDTLTDKVEVVSITRIDTTIPDKAHPSNLLQHQQITVSAYDSGFFAIPGFKFVVDHDTAHAMFTQPLFLEVHTIPTDTSAAKIKDIKPPFNEPFNWKWYMSTILWSLAAVLIIGIAIILFYYYKWRNKQVIVEPQKPKIPAHITALAALEKIKNEQVWRENKVKEYYSSISEAVRQYIEERFEVNALESTTDEIMTAFRSRVIDRESKEKLQQLLTLSDLVKFAKMFPVEAEHLFTLQHAFDFVNGTKREEVENLDEAPATITEPSVHMPPVTPTYERTAEPIIKDNPSQGYTTSYQSSQPVPDHYKTNGTAAPISSDNNNAARRAKKMRIIGLSFTLVLFCLLTFFMQRRCSAPSFDKAMLETVNQVNSMCPVTVDSETRLDNCGLMSNDEVMFNFTLVNVTSGQVDLTILKSKLEPEIINQVKSHPNLTNFRDHNVTIDYNYKDRNGTFLFTIKVTPRDYNSSTTI